MKAVRWHGRNDVRLEDVAEPGPPAPGMVTVAVDLCGICGTDIAEFTEGPLLIRTEAHPLTGCEPPVTLGHEMLGKVVQVGDGACDIRAGDRVTADACWRCGTCHYCRRGSYHLCPQGGSLGLHSDGALASLVQLPAYMLVPVPDEVPDLAAVLTEPLAVGLHALDQADVSPGSHVVILGFGAVGASVAISSSLAGMHITVIETRASRRARAQSLGFPRVLDPEQDDPRRAIKGETEGLGADAVFECTGKQSLIPDALELCRRGGTIVLVGLGAGQTQLDARRVVYFERRIIGSLGYRHDLPRVLKLLAAGSMNVDGLAPEVIALHDAVSSGFEVLAQPTQESHFKIVVDCR